MQNPIDEIVDWELYEDAEFGLSILDVTKRSGVELNERFPVGLICVADEMIKCFSDSGKEDNAGDMIDTKENVKFE